MPLPALEDDRARVPVDRRHLRRVRQDLSGAGSAIGTDTGHDAAHVDCAANNDVVVRAVVLIRVRECHDRVARFRQLRCLVEQEAVSALAVFRRTGSSRCRRKC